MWWSTAPSSLGTPWQTPATWHLKSSPTILQPGPPAFSDHAHTEKPRPSLSDDNPYSSRPHTPPSGSHYTLDLLFTPHIFFLSRKGWYLSWEPPDLRRALLSCHGPHLIVCPLVPFHSQLPIAHPLPSPQSSFLFLFVRVSVSFLFG